MDYCPLTIWLSRIVGTLPCTLYLYLFWHNRKDIPRGIRGWCFRAGHSDSYWILAHVGRPPFFTVHFSLFFLPSPNSRTLTSEVEGLGLHSVGLADRNNKSGLYYCLVLAVSACLRSNTDLGLHRCHTGVRTIHADRATSALLLHTCGICVRGDSGLFISTICFLARLSVYEIRGL